MRLPWRRRHRDLELEEEIQTHLDMAARERMARGESADAAAHAARREFGNVGQVKELTRHVGRGTTRACAPRDTLRAPFLAPYARLDGLFWRVVPYADPPASRADLRRNLLQVYQYRGYADPAVPLDEMSRILGFNYYPPLVALARAEYTAGGADQCRQVRQAVLGALPLARLQPDARLRQEIDGACAAPAASRR